MNNYKISVIVPCFNAENEIAETIECILAQTYKPAEVLVVDDGSTDRTQEIISKYPVEYIYQSNSGPSKARNLAIQKAASDWIAFCDSDDRWHRDKLKLQVDVLKAQPELGFVVSNAMNIHRINSSEQRSITVAARANGPRIQIITMTDWIRNVGIYPSAIVVRKNLLEAAGGFDEKRKHYEDYLLWTRIVKASRGVFLNEPLFERLIRPNSLSHGNTKKQRQAQVECLEKALLEFSEYAKEIKRNLSHSLYSLMRIALSENNCLEARQLLRRAILANPFIGSFYWRENDSLFVKSRKFFSPFFIFLFSYAPNQVFKLLVKKIKFSVSGVDVMKAW